MPSGTLASRLRSSITLLIFFPLFTLTFIAILIPIPVLGNLTFAAITFSAPGMWILAAMRDIYTAPSFQTTAALWIHYPILGFMAGYLFPFDVAFTRSCAKQIAIRYGLCMLGAAAIGIAIALYAAAYDS
ncbi:MAG: hypothetical protein VR76_07920 [Pseudomonas sp. BRH_c35]|nr:MAG: hypothetical protein VR76_07920 [Pseudomonas sp. BRH_c35]